MALTRFESVRGECTYLRSDCGSNFMGVRNQDASNECTHLTPELVGELLEDWSRQGKVWDISPPGASHVGGVWERKIGQIRQVLSGYILTSDRSNLSSEELMTFLQQAARVVNSTPLWEAPDTSNDPMPITPHQLITQRDDNCGNSFLRPSLYSSDDLLAYGANRWKRACVLADEFERYWKQYIYEIGDKRDKWNISRRNAQVGDLVLI